MNKTQRMGYGLQSPQERGWVWAYVLNRGIRQCDRVAIGHIPCSRIPCAGQQGLESLLLCGHLLQGESQSEAPCTWVTALIPDGC